ncbi:MAG: NAD(+) synthase [Leptospirales bacterium]|nr:NAD(+) synthase [Leptospirales bacterium]
MLTVAVATLAVNQTPLDWSGNLDRILRALRTLGKPIDLALFPELCITGYGCEDAFHSPDVQERALQLLREIAQEADRRLPGGAVIVGLPIARNDRLYNCAAVLNGGRIAGITAKGRLAGDGVHYEPRWFSAWHGQQTEVIEIDGQSIPFGNPLFALGDIRFAIEICEDAWVPDRPGVQHLNGGVDLLLNPSASHFAFGKFELRRRIVQESSRNFGCAYAMVNLLGNEAGRMIYDGAAVVAAGGEMLLEDRGFSFADYRVQNTLIDLERLRVQRARQYSFVRQGDATPGPVAPVQLLRGRTRTIGFGSPPNSANASPLPRTCWAETVGAAQLASREAEFLRAEGLGLFDYLRKSHSRGFVISLSGGADSACCAVLVQRMLALAIAELGPRECLERLGRRDLIELLPDESHESEDGLRKIVPVLSSQLLLTVYQSTRQSSETTRSAASALADALHADHYEIDVEEQAAAYLQRGAAIAGRTLEWKTDDLALQNIQARTRAPMVWLLANLRGDLLLTTSNRSEAAVGYCTMDGDTAGGLAPIAGIDKHFVQNWLRWMEIQGDWLLGPIAALQAITRQAPTAELRPAAAGQSDESDLMPYRLLDRIERLAIRDRKPPAEIFEHLHADPEWSDANQLRAAIRRFFELWSRNQWKRERYAPSFHLDDVNLDPRSWYRFPILNGGYRTELDEMDDQAAGGANR